jgi:hypothetical protein
MFLGMENGQNKVSLGYASVYYEFVNKKMSSLYEV